VEILKNGGLMKLSTLQRVVALATQFRDANYEYPAAATARCDLR
jgi:hypothetical protein